MVILHRLNSAHVLDLWRLFPQGDPSSCSFPLRDCDVSNCFHGSNSAVSSATQLSATFGRQKSHGGRAELIRVHANATQNIRSHAAATGMDTMVSGVARCRLTVVRVRVGEGWGGKVAVVR